jgi:hypothetical protein
MARGASAIQNLTGKDSSRCVCQASRLSNEASSSEGGLRVAGRPQ